MNLIFSKPLKDIKNVSREGVKYKLIFINLVGCAPLFLSCIFTRYYFLGDMHSVPWNIIEYLYFLAFVPGIVMSLKAVEIKKSFINNFLMITTFPTYFFRLLKLKKSQIVYKVENSNINFYVLSAHFHLNNSKFKGISNSDARSAFIDFQVKNI